LSFVYAQDAMKRRRALIITAGTAGLVLLGCVLFFSARSGANVEVQYGEVLADKNDVRTIRQICFARALGGAG